jgi:hypothetical protein
MVCARRLVVPLRITSSWLPFPLQAERSDGYSFNWPWASADQSAHGAWVCRKLNFCLQEPSAFRGQSRRASGPLSRPRLR